MRTTLITLIIIILFSGFSIAQNEKPKVKDDPNGRILFEQNLLKNPNTGKIPKNIREKELNYVLSSKSGLQNKAAKATTWNKRGPFNVGGRTRALAIDVDNNYIIAGGVSGGIWKSDDDGETWTRKTLPGDHPSVTAIAQDPRTGHTNKWYYMTGEYRGNSASESGAYYQGDGIWFSNDHGETWSRMEGTYDDGQHTFVSYFDYGWNIKVDPTTGDVYAATYGRIYVLREGTTDWTVSLDSKNTSSNSRYTDVDIAADGTLYAGFSASGDKWGVYTSGDGNSWTDITPDFSPIDIQRVSIACAPSNADIVYVLGDTDTDEYFIWKYEKGIGWTDRSDNVPMDGGYTGDFNSQGGYNLIAKVKPDDEDVLLIGGTNLYLSTDGFVTTTNTNWIGGYDSDNNGYGNYDNHHADQHSLFFAPNDASILYSGHDGGISKTTNCLATTVNWTALNNGYVTTQAYTIALDHSASQAKYLMMGFQDNGSWITDSEEFVTGWYKNGSGDGSYCAIADDAKTIYSSSQKGHVYADYYDDNYNYVGWTRVYPEVSDNVMFINPFIIDPNDNNIMYFLDGGKIYRHTDLGSLRDNLSSNTAPSGWEEVSGATYYSGYISAIAISRNHANILIYGTDDGKVYKIENANSYPVTKTDITETSLFPADGYISCVAIDPANHNNILVTFSNYEVRSIFFSDDGGSTWEDVSGNLEENADGTGNGPSVRWAMFHKQDNDEGNMYYVGTSTGLYSTSTLYPTSGDVQWTQEGASIIGNVVVTMIKNRISDGLVAVATHANGAYTAVVETGGDNITKVEQVKKIEGQIKVYPNPSSHIINLDMNFENKTSLNIAIYNLQGQMLYFSQVKDQVKNFNKEIDISGFADGMYKIEVLTNKGLITKNVVKSK